MGSKIFSQLVILFFFLSFFISYQLWGAERQFPMFPIVSGLENQNLLNLILPYLVLFSGVAGILRPDKRLIVTFVFTLLLSIAFDQMRLQPWVYFYLLCLSSSVFCKTWSDQKKFLRVMFIGLYFWSGVQKLNPHFDDVVFESILIDGFKLKSISQIELGRKISMLVPIIEIAIAIFLFMPKLKKTGVIIAVLSHSFIIYYLTFGLFGNWVVVPWNLFMIVCLLFIIYPDKAPKTLPKNVAIQVVTILCLFVFPIGKILGFTDQSLSFSLYDGTYKHAYILNKRCESEESMDLNLIDKGCIIDLNTSSYKELAVPFYTEKRFLKRLLKKGDADQIILTHIPFWERNLLATYKTQESKLNLTKVKSLGPVVFRDSVYIGSYEVIKP